MPCLDDDVSKIICAINENASVRPYDIIILYIALFSVLSTIAVSVLLWLLDRRTSRRNARSEAVDSFISLIDRVNVPLIGDASDKKLAFDNQISYITRIFKSFFRLDKKNIGLASLIMGQIEFAGIRMKGVSDGNKDMQIRQKLIELYSDIHNVRTQWEVSAGFRRRVKKFQKKNESNGYLISWEDAIKLFNG